MGPDEILVDGRRVPVPDTPINFHATLSGMRRPFMRATGDVLTLDLGRGMRPFGGLLIAWGLAAGVAGAGAVARDADPFVLVVFFGQAALLPTMGAVFCLIPARHEFDRAAGEYRRRQALAPARRPLAEIAAVQVIRGRAVDDSDGCRRQTYELNLVIAAGGVRREAITCMPDDDWLTEAGRAVGEFLGVPIFRRVAG